VGGVEVEARPPGIFVIRKKSLGAVGCEKKSDKCGWGGVEARPQGIFVIRKKSLGVKKE
jgi:uncharacterized protein YigE (DUF2233 family)